MEIIRLCWGCGKGRHNFKRVKLVSIVGKWNPRLRKKKLMYEFPDKSMCCDCLSPYMYLMLFEEN